MTDRRAIVTRLVDGVVREDRSWVDEEVVEVADMRVRLRLVRSKQRHHRRSGIRIEAYYTEPGNPTPWRFIRWTAPGSSRQQVFRACMTMLSRVESDAALLWLARQKTTPGEPGAAHITKEESRN